MITILAEKPSIANDIARIVGATNKKGAYLEGNGYTVTWAFGHLVTLVGPNERGFHRENLPILPKTFNLIPRQDKNKADRGVMEQLKVIKRLFNSCDRIIVATDAGREGELIFRFIYEYLNCKKPFDKLWISSLTDKAIEEGMDKLKSGAEYDNLYHSARARSEADWLIGINATQAASIAAGGGIYSLGRVQTPTLCMICKRHAENREFNSQKYWRMNLSAECEDKILQFVSSKQWFDEAGVKSFFEKLQGVQSLVVSRVETNELNQSAPLLYDLTALQKEANRKYGYTAQETLSLAQSLYEAKYITYPRTGSQYISEDIFAQVPKLILFIAKHTQFSEYAKCLENLNSRCVNDKKVSDHHALLITGVKVSKLTREQHNIYNMIIARMLEAFSDRCIKEVTKAAVICNDEEFAIKGSLIKQLGWRGVLNEQDEEDVATLPFLNVGDKLIVGACSISEGKTKPKPLHTESSLLAAMEAAGRDLEDDELRESLKECGIGTPATRAAIIETLIARGYVVRSNKSLVPSEVGRALYSVVKPMRIANVEMTGEWESALSKIARGEMKASTFKREIESYTKQVVRELLASRILFPEDNAPLTCPKCKKGKMRFFAKVVKCDNEACGLPIFRQVCDKQLSDEHISTLIKKRKTALIKGFRSKAGKRFDAALTFDNKFSVSFIFPN